MPGGQNGLQSHSTVRLQTGIVDLPFDPLPQANENAVLRYAARRMEFLVRVHGHTDVDSPFRVAYGTNVDSRGSGDPRGWRDGRKKFMAKGYVSELKVVIQMHFPKY